MHGTCILSICVTEVEIGQVGLLKKKKIQVVVAHAFSPSTWETGGFLCVLGQPGL